MKILASKKDIIHISILKEFVSKILIQEYKLSIAQYTQTVQDKFEKVRHLIREFQKCKDRTTKYDIYKQIVDMFKTEEVIFDSSDEIPSKLVEVIEYGFQIQDLHSVALLMEKRKEILNYLLGYDVKEDAYGKRLNSQVLYKKFVKMIAEQCDDTTASQYLEKLIAGKYLMLQYETERFGWRIYKEDIIKEYMSYKAMQKGRTKFTNSTASEADE